MAVEEVVAVTRSDPKFMEPSAKVPPPSEDEE
jgi:hypothetical protein